MLDSAFNALLSIHSKKMTIERVGELAEADIKVSPSNYFRNQEGPSETVIEGREFIIGIKNIPAGYLPLKRGDRLKADDIGECVIDEIREMYDLGTKIIGFRVVTS